MEFALFLFVVSMRPLALAAVVLPVVGMAVGRRHRLLAALLLVATLTMLGFWLAALDANMDWADRTGGQGSALAGVGWFLGAMAAAAAATVVPLRRSGTRRVA